MRKETIRFESFDLSSAGFVRPSAVMRRMQQAARDDLHSFGITYDGMREKNMAFVVSRMALLFERPVPGEKPLFLKTAANLTRGATFPRSFLMWDEDGVIMRAMSLWALIDFEKRMLLRPAALGEEIPTFDDLSDGLTCSRFSVPSETCNFYEERKVYSSLLDQNRHLNNCNYADLATDLLPDSDAVVKELQISFQKEALLGDVLEMKGFGNVNELIVSGTFMGRNETCFTCQIKTFKE